MLLCGILCLYHFTFASYDVRIQLQYHTENGDTAVIEEFLDAAVTMGSDSVKAWWSRRWSTMPVTCPIADRSIG